MRRKPVKRRKAAARSTAPSLKSLLAKARREGWREWVRTKADEHALTTGHYFDLARAERCREFFRKFIRHTLDRWAGQPFEPLQWQWEQIIAPMFGWRRADGRRRFTKVFITLPKKQGKTTLISALNTFLMIDEPPGTEIVIAAGDREQASICFRESAAMVRAHPALARRFRIKDSTKHMFYASGVGRPSIYKALSSDAFTKEGLNPSVIVCDELHAWPGRELFDCLAYASSSRSEPLFIIISTAGDDKETVMGEEYDAAVDWKHGLYINDAYFAVIYEADKTDPWDDPKTWKKANPSLGTTIMLDKFQQDFLEARQSPAKENNFRRYRLNQWVQSAATWLSLDAWDRGAAPIDVDALAGRECIVGIDLSSTSDTTALVPIFEEPDQSIIVVPKFYLPKDNIVALEKKHKIGYTTWERAGLFVLTEGNVIDYDAIRADLRALAEIYVIKHVSIDRKFQGQQLELQLQADGFDVTPAGQGYVAQDLPMRALEAMVNAGRIRHGGHPVLRWHASNAVCKINDKGNYSLNKRLARGKIDGIAALIQAIYASDQLAALKLKNDGEAVDWTKEKFTLT